MVDRAIGALLVSLLLVAGCGEDDCKSYSPAFEVTILLASSMDPSSVKGLDVEATAGTFQRKQSFSITDQFDDGRTSFDARVGEAGEGGFTAEVTVTARDEKKKVLAHQQETFEASGDACNFFSMTLAPGPAAGCTDGDSRSCYGGPAGTAGVGLCKAGKQTCTSKKWGSCVGEVKPAAETCDGQDNDCDGSKDESLTRSCYSGPAGTEGKGLCRAGKQTCTSKKWGSCVGEVKPVAETCDGEDNDCDGKIDDGLQPGPTCWDISAVFSKTVVEYPSHAPQIFGANVQDGVTRYAFLDGQSDDTYTEPLYTPSGQCTKYEKNPFNTPRTWDIERKSLGSNTYRIQVRGSSDADCNYGPIQPVCAGEILVNSSRGWKISKEEVCKVTEDKYESNNELIPTNCDVDQAKGKISWQSGSSCGGCCACPRGASVEIKVVVSK